jgi:hypothetical protein
MKVTISRIVFAQLANHFFLRSSAACAKSPAISFRHPDKVDETESDTRIALFGRIALVGSTRARRPHTPSNKALAKCEKITQPTLLKRKYRGRSDYIRVYAKVLT